MDIYGFYYQFSIVVTLPEEELILGTFTTNSQLFWGVDINGFQYRFLFVVTLFEEG